MAPTSYLRTVSWLHVYSVPASGKENIPCHLFRFVAAVYRRLLQTVRGTVETLGTQTKGNWAGTGRACWVRTTMLAAITASLSIASQGKRRYLQVFSRSFGFHISQNKTLVSNNRKQTLELFETFLKWFHGEKRKSHLGPSSN